DTFVLVDHGKTVFIVSNCVNRTAELTRPLQMCNRIIRTCLCTLSALFTLGCINMGPVSSLFDCSEFTCVDTCFSKTVLTVFSHCITGNRTVLTRRINDLNNISIILFTRRLSFCQTNSLTYDFSFFVNTASKLRKRSRNQSACNVIPLFFQFSFKSQPRHFIQYLMFDCDYIFISVHVSLLSPFFLTLSLMR